MSYHMGKSHITWSCGMDMATTWHTPDAISCDAASTMAWGE